jgi:hypothetical protein
MDWIERWLGVSPDNGDGSLEALILIALVAVPMGFRILGASRVGAALRSLLAARQGRVPR